MIPAPDGYREYLIRLGEVHELTASVVAVADYFVALLDKHSSLHELAEEYKTMLPNFGANSMYILSLHRLKHCVAQPNGTLAPLTCQPHPATSHNATSLLLRPSRP